jgi:hypothetical protein
MARSSARTQKKLSLLSLLTQAGTQIEPVCSRNILRTAQFDRCLKGAFECGESRPDWLPLVDGGNAEEKEEGKDG